MSNDVGIDFSVIIVTHNNHNEITGCLSTLVEQLENQQSEIFLVDNASSDGTVQRVRNVLKKIRSKKHNINVISNKSNVGFTRALNQGLNSVQGEFVIVLNPDVELQPNCLQVLKDRCNRMSRQVVAAPQLLFSDGSIQASCRRFPKRRDVWFAAFGLNRIFVSSKIFNGWKMGDFDHRSAREVDQPQGAFLMFARQILERVGLWDETFPMFFSDVDWCYRVRKAGFTIFFEPAAQAIHHKGASVNRDRAEMIRSSHRSFYDYFKKHRRRPAIATFLTGRLLRVTKGLRIAGHRIMSNAKLKGV